jgi:2-phospho-L-lactate guanylyltransferase
VSAIRAIVPIRPLHTCKRRLASALPDSTREALVLLMLSRTVRVVAEATGSGGCCIVGGDEWIRRIAAETGVGWREDRHTDLNAAVFDAMLSAYREGARAAMFIPADVPMIGARDVEAIIAASEQFTLPVGVEATADGGTNGLLVPAGVGMAPELGQGSYERHRAQARRLGTRLATASAPGLAFDLDVPADLAFALSDIPGFATELRDWELRVEREAVDPTLSAARL